MSLSFEELKVDGLWGVCEGRNIQGEAQKAVETQESGREPHHVSQLASLVDRESLGRFSGPAPEQQESHSHSSRGIRNARSWSWASVEHSPPWWVRPEHPVLNSRAGGECLSSGTECFGRSRISAIRTISGTVRQIMSLTVHPLGLDAPSANQRLAARPRCLIHPSSSGIELVGDKKLPSSILKTTHQLPGDNSRTCPIVQSHRVPFVDDLLSTTLSRHQRGGI